MILIYLLLHESAGEPLIRLFLSTQALPVITLLPGNEPYLCPWLSMTRCVFM